ncbi:MAG: hypothetical protein LBR12_01005, partial [Opitutaceae bacterium]|nr:hypothetical protein [Opitutaceae bacterium]
MSSDLFFFGALTGAIILTQIVWRRASPIGHIVNRWVRWAVFSLCGAKLLSDALDRPYWLLAAMLALLWLALETLYNWIAIKAISASRLPLFPRFAPSAGDIELIQHPRFRKL